MEKRGYNNQNNRSGHYRYIENGKKKMKKSDINVQLFGINCKVGFVTLL